LERHTPFFSIDGKAVLFRRMSKRIKALIKGQIIEKNRLLIRVYLLTVKFTLLKQKVLFMKMSMAEKDLTGIPPKPKEMSIKASKNISKVFVVALYST
jgi:hypothetical protein